MLPTLPAPSFPNRHCEIAPKLHHFMLPADNHNTHLGYWEPHRGFCQSVRPGEIAIISHARRLSHPSINKPKCPKMPNAHARTGLATRRRGTPEPPTFHFAMKPCFPIGACVHPNAHALKGSSLQGPISFMGDGWLHTPECILTS